MTELGDSINTMSFGGSVQGGEENWPGTTLRRSSVACAIARYLNGLGPDPTDEDGTAAYELVRLERPA